MGKLADIFNRNKRLTDLAYLLDEEDDINDKAQEVYLKRMALDICANFVARAAGQSVFKTPSPDWHYKLNSKPNRNMSATEFWEQFIYKLVVDNRVLAILSDTDDLLIADSWTRNEYAVYEDTFENVTVKGYTFSRTFKMGDVLYLEYGNEKLEKFTNGLIEDYGELYGRLVEAAKRNNQIRGTVSIDAPKALDDSEKAKMQGYVDKLFNAFQSRSIAIAPLMKGFDYKEHSNVAAASSVSIDEIVKIPDSLTNTVADALGIPTALLHGNRAELRDNMTAFNSYCLAPLLKKIEAELNAKITSPKDYLDGERIEVIGINKPNIFELSNAIDKLVSSGTFSHNELRIACGYDPREGGDKYYITKNYETLSLKGGEEE